MISLEYCDPRGLAWAQATVARHHYLRTPVDPRCSPEAWAVCLGDLGRVGCLIVGRPQATRCYPWYGSEEDVATSKAEVTRWEVLNLARVWLDPRVQPGGDWHQPGLVPGYTDRRGVFRSTLASAAIGQLAAVASAGYLTARPPVFLDEPYALRWLLSYCDTTKHRGVVYRASGFSLYRTNAAGMQTWRLPLGPLTVSEDAAIREASRWSARARRLRAGRGSAIGQLALAEGG